MSLNKARRATLGRLTVFLLGAQYFLATEDVLAKSASGKAIESEKIADDPLRIIANERMVYGLSSPDSVRADAVDDIVRIGDALRSGMTTVEIDQAVDNIRRDFHHLVYSLANSKMYERQALIDMKWIMRRIEEELKFAADALKDKTEVEKVRLSVRMASDNFLKNLEQLPVKQ